MDRLGDEMCTVAMHVVTAIERVRAMAKRPILVAVDGPSGSGKSILASLLARKLDAALIPLDDFFAADIPDSRWDQYPVEEKLAHVFRWDRVRTEVIQPLLQGRTVQWCAFDFQSGPRADGTYGMETEAKVRDPAQVILLDGAYSAGPQLTDLVDLAILVDAPDEVRQARLAAREDAAFLEGWRKRWDAVERHYFTKVRPPRSFDLIVRNPQDSKDASLERSRSRTSQRG